MAIMEIIIGNPGLVLAASVTLVAIVMFLVKCATCWQDMKRLDEGLSPVAARQLSSKSKQSTETSALHTSQSYDRLAVPTLQRGRSLGSVEGISSLSSSRSTLYQSSIEDTIIENVPLDFNVDWPVERINDLPDVLPLASKSAAPSPELQRRERVCMKRSTSVPTMMDSNFKPHMECKILYDKEVSELKIYGICAFDLVYPVGNNTFVLINVSLVPLGMKASTEAHEITLCPSFKQEIIFDGITADDIDKAVLYVAVKAASTRKVEKRKGSVIAELPLKLSELHLYKGEQAISQLLNTNRRIKRESTSEIFLHMELGQLFLLLQYQSAANRMKVLIRKATNLPKSQKLPGQPEHFVVINLIRKHFVVDAKETKLKKGCNPIWNEPFLFDLPTRDSKNYSFDFIVMNGGKYSKDSVVGHVTVGPDTTKSGIAHWTEAMSPMGVDSAKWHTILPRFQY